MGNDDSPLDDLYRFERDPLPPFRARVSSRKLPIDLYCVKEDAYAVGAELDVHTL